MGIECEGRVKVGTGDKNTMLTNDAPRRCSDWEWGS